MYKCTNVNMYKYICFQIYTCKTNAYMFKYILVQIYTCSNAYIFKSVHKYT